MMIAYIITFTTKLLIDIYVFLIFIRALAYFLRRKRAALKREALMFTPHHQLVLYVIFFLLFMRILGSVYTFIVGVLVLIPSVFNSAAQMLSYVILDDLVFPLRDFIEVMMFSYMFYQQSNNRGKKNLDIINERWRKNIKAHGNSMISSSEEGMREQAVVMNGIKEHSKSPKEIHHHL
jgi:hypothetical protein